MHLLYLPEVKVRLGKPRRNRRRDPHEDPKKPWNLSAYKKKMMCRTYHKLGHNKRTCPSNDKQSNVAPPSKRNKGIPRSNPEIVTNPEDVTIAPSSIRGR